MSDNLAPETFHKQTITLQKKSGDFESDGWGYANFHLHQDKKIPFWLVFVVSKKKPLPAIFYTLKDAQDFTIELSKMNMD